MPEIPVIPPGASPGELAAQRRITEAFIAANPSLVALIPRSRQKSGSGVRWMDLPARPAQKVRLIDPGAGVGGVSANTAAGGDGIQRKVPFQLLLPWGGQVGLYDYWVDTEGIRWEVTNLLPYNGYERRAEVIRLGESG